MISVYLIISYYSWHETILVQMPLLMEFLACIICQIYCRPTYACFEETRGSKSNKSTSHFPFPLRNRPAQLIFTSIFMVLVTLIAAAMPFFGDSVSICGAIGFTPLDFVFPALAYLKAGRTTNNSKHGLLMRPLNILIATWFSIVAVLGCIGAVRFIVVDIKNYKFFHDMWEFWTTPEILFSLFSLGKLYFIPHFFLSKSNKYRNYKIIHYIPSVLKYIYTSWSWSHLKDSETSRLLVISFKWWWIGHVYATHVIIFFNESTTWYIVYFGAFLSPVYIQNSFFSC